MNTDFIHGPQCRRICLFVWKCVAVFCTLRKKNQTNTARICHEGYALQFIIMMNATQCDDLGINPFPRHNSHPFCQQMSTSIRAHPSHSPGANEFVALKHALPLVHRFDGHKIDKSRSVCRRCHRARIRGGHRAGHHHAGRGGAAGRCWGGAEAAAAAAAAKMFHGGRRTAVHAAANGADSVHSHAIGGFRMAMSSNVDCFVKLWVALVWQLYFKTIRLYVVRNCDWQWWVWCSELWTDRNVSWTPTERSCSGVHSKNPAASFCTPNALHPASICGLHSLIRLVRWSWARNFVMHSLSTRNIYNTIGILCLCVFKCKQLMNELDISSRTAKHNNTTHNVEVFFFAGTVTVWRSPAMTVGQYTMGVRLRVLFTQFILAPNEWRYAG